MRLFAPVGAAFAVAVAAAAIPASSTNTECRDYHRWLDSYNYQCVHYEESRYCTSSGQPGVGWTAEWGRISDWKVPGGHDATEACCACGGGHRTGLDSSQAPSQEPLKKRRVKRSDQEKSRKVAEKPRKPGIVNGGPERRAVSSPGTMSNREWKSKLGSRHGNYDEGWNYAGRVPALPPRHAPYDLVAKGGTMICHMSEEELQSAPSGTPFFVHIAKTGGRALIRYLQNVLGDKYCEDWIYLHVNPSFNPPPDAGAAVIDEACKFKLDSYMSSLRAFTVVRDPLERLVSELGHTRVMPRVKDSSGSLEEHFMKVYSRRWYTNFQTGVLSGYRVCAGTADVGRQQLEDVKQLIRDGKLLVATTEDMEASLNLIFDDISQTMPEAIKTSFDTVEKKPKTSSIPSLVEDLRAGASSELARIYENFRQLNALDYELYEFVKEHIKSRSSRAEL